MANEIGLKRKTPTPTIKKARLTMKAFARLQGADTLNKAIDKMTKLIESQNLEDNSVGFSALGKILPYILPKQSDGNTLQVQINNNLVAGEVTKDGKTVITLQQLVKARGLNGMTEGDSVEFVEVGAGEK